MHEEVIEVNHTAAPGTTSLDSLNQAFEDGVTPASVKESISLAGSLLAGAPLWMLRELCCCLADRFCLLLALTQRGSSHVAQGN